MTDGEELTAIAAAVYAYDADLGFRLQGIALRVRRQERALDEIAEQARVDARVANAVAVEHLAKYRAP